jgi:hypothetical protein
LKGFDRLQEDVLFFTFSGEGVPYREGDGGTIVLGRKARIAATQTSGQEDRTEQNGDQSGSPSLPTTPWTRHERGKEVVD